MMNEVCPVTGPAAVGLKRTAQMPDCPLCSVRVHPYSRTNTLKGVIEKLVMVSSVVPVLVIVISVTPVSIPTTMLLKAMELGLILNDCAATALAAQVVNRQPTAKKQTTDLKVNWDLIMTSEIYTTEWPSNDAALSVEKYSSTPPSPPPTSTPPSPTSAEPTSPTPPPASSASRKSPPSSLPSARVIRRAPLFPHSSPQFSFRS